MEYLWNYLRNKFNWGFENIIKEVIHEYYPPFWNRDNWEYKEKDCWVQCSFKGRRAEDFAWMTIVKRGEFHLLRIFLFIVIENNLTYLNYLIFKYLKTFQFHFWSKSKVTEINKLIRTRVYSLSFFETTWVYSYEVSYELFY